MNTRKPLITVTGQPGAGKTTACKNLAAELGWEYFYTGLIMRALAEKRGISITAMNQLAETDKTINQEIDAVYEQLKNDGKPRVIDARLAWHFLPESFKVRFEVPVAIGAARVLTAEKRTSEEYHDLQSAIAFMTTRRASEKIQYRDMYDVEDVEDYNHFDLVLDTAYSSPERNVSMVRSVYALWQKGIRLPKIWLSPKSLYPTRDITSLQTDKITALAESVARHGFDVLAPVTAAVINDQFYIVDGHKRAGAALRAGCDFVPVVLLDHKVTPNADLVSAWERAFGFGFATAVK